LLYFALHVLFVSHETFCFYQTVYIFIYSAYKLQVCSLNFCSGLLSEESSILESCCLRLMLRNSVLEELRVRRFADTQEEMCLRANNLLISIVQQISNINNYSVGITIRYDTIEEFSVDV